MTQATAALPVTDPRAHALRARFHAKFAADELPVPVEAIAEDLLGLRVEDGDIPCSGLLLPAGRLIVLRADEPPARQRFTLAHELGHWVCQVREGRGKAVYCRAQDVVPSADRLREREANVFAAELLMPEEAVRTEWARAAVGRGAGGVVRRQRGGDELAAVQLRARRGAAALMPYQHEARLGAGFEC